MITHEGWTNNQLQNKLSHDPDHTRRHDYDIFLTFWLILARYEKCLEITSAMIWRHINKSDLAILKNLAFILIFLVLTLAVLRHKSETQMIVFSHFAVQF